MNSKAKFFAMFIILVVVGGLLYYYLMGKPASAATDFTSCKAAGYPIIETSPQQCLSPDGKTFTEILSGNDSEMANPASVFCKDNNGTLAIRTDDLGNQYGVCVFSNGAECDEWAYFRGECRMETITSLGKTVTLGIGELARIPNINLEIKLSDVGNDSRCPTGVECITAGSVSVIMDAMTANRNGTIRITYRPGAEDAARDSFAGYNVKILSVSPENTQEGIKKNAYKVTLSVSKDEQQTDYSCKTDSDCAVKNIGNLCGEFTDCVNKDYTPVPPELDSESCEHPKIDGCKCVVERCIGTIGGKLNQN